jgi:hypothetical protein
VMAIIPIPLRYMTFDADTAFTFKSANDDPLNDMIVLGNPSFRTSPLSFLFISIGV